MKITDMGAAIDPQFERVSDTPRTDVAQHNMGSVLEPDYVVDADFSRYLERELAEAKKDAERYRWLRDEAQNTMEQQKAWLASNKLDDNIDAAMKEGEMSDTPRTDAAEAVAKERERCALVCERKIVAPAGTYQILMAAAKEIRRGE